LASVKTKKYKARQRAQVRDEYAITRCAWAMEYKYRIKPDFERVIVSDTYIVEILQTAPEHLSVQNT